MITLDHGGELQAEPIYNANRQSTLNKYASTTESHSDLDPETKKDEDPDLLKIPTFIDHDEPIAPDVFQDIFQSAYEKNITRVWRFH